MSRDILQHIPESQKTFAKQLIHKLINLKQAEYAIDFGFVDPAELQLMIQLAKTYQVKITIDPITNLCERKHVLLGFGEIDSAIILKGEYNNKFNELEHRHVLGTIINGTTDFNKIGDIKVDEGYFELFCLKEVESEITSEFSYINKAKIRYFEVEKPSILDDELVETTINISSMRLDNVVKAMVKKARTKSQKIIKNKDVKVNYVEITNPNFEIKENDLISVRKYGRKRVKQISQTKTGKYRVVIE